MVASFQPSSYLIQRSPCPHVTLDGRIHGAGTREAGDHHAHMSHFEKLVKLLSHPQEDWTACHLCGGLHLNWVSAAVALSSVPAVLCDVISVVIEFMVNNLQ
jgi:hypothetical protein